MSDWDEDEEDAMSLDDLESLEHDREKEGLSPIDEEDWGDSYDDLDSEAWERQYELDEELDVEKDPWDLN